MPYIPSAESAFGLLLRVVFWGAVVYAVMRTIWAIWEIADRLSDIDRTLSRLGVEVRELVNHLRETSEARKEQTQK